MPPSAKQYLWQGGQQPTVIFYVKKATPPPPPPKYRDAGDGQYVTKEYAEKHLKTTVKETEKSK